MINGVTTSIRFLQQNIHKRKDFPAKFSILIIPEPRAFKILLDHQEQKKIFSQTYILYDESGVVKPTFVSELHQEINIFFRIYNILLKKR